MNACYVDVETTGLRPGRDRIVEIAAVWVSGIGEETDHFESLVYPGIEAMALWEGSVAERKTQISLGDLAAAPQPDAIAELFKDFLKNHIHLYGSVRLHAFNRPFDARFLAEPPWSVSFDLWGECVMRAAWRALDPRGKGKWPTLEHAAESLGLEWNRQAHRALEDARMASRVHRACGDPRKAIV